MQVVTLALFGWWGIALWWPIFRVIRVNLLQPAKLRSQLGHGGLILIALYLEPVDFCLAQVAPVAVLHIIPRCLL